MLEQLWQQIPIGKENAVTYSQLCDMWEASERTVRRRLHELSYFDNGDNLILIRSSHGKGFYRTDNLAEIESYKRECTNRARHTFAPLRKIRRVLSAENMHKSG